jgi:hypothetical protein
VNFWIGTVMIRILWTVMKLLIQSRPSYNETEVCYNFGHEPVLIHTDVCICTHKHMFTHVCATCTPWTIHAPIHPFIHTHTMYTYAHVHTVIHIGSDSFIHILSTSQTVNCCFITDHFNEVTIFMIILKATWQISTVSHSLWEAIFQRLLLKHYQMGMQEPRFCGGQIWGLLVHLFLGSC